MATIKKTSWFFLFSPNRHLLDVFVGIAAVVMPMLSMDFAVAVTIDWVTVGNPGNANDPATGDLYGAVAEEFRIAKHLVTIQQYTDFLNAVAQTDTYSLYNAYMASNLWIAGISRSGTSGGYSYSVINNGGPSGNRPITYVSWFDAARFANWMHNGQLTGSAGAASTETGAYTLIGGQTRGTAPARNPGAQFYIPTESQWYKAAYYSPTLNSGSGGYYSYATQSNTAPGNVVGGGANQANYYLDRFSVTQAQIESFDQNYLTDVGAFTNSASFYGTFDQSGLVYEWNDLTGAAGWFRGLRGGDWSSFNGAFFMSSSYGFPYDADGESSSIGFRLASPVPEPATLGLASGGALCACGWWVLKRRRRART